MDLTADDFEPFVGQTFQPHGNPRSLTLVTVDTRQRPGWEGAPRKPFTLMLRGPSGDVVPEGFYRFTAGGQRDFELYLVPVQTFSREYQDYQIVFN
jgi:hypothetical protein